MPTNTVTKIGGVALSAFADIPIPSLFEFGSTLYVRIPDAVQTGSQTVLNAIRVKDFTVTSFLPTDQVYPATATVTAEYSTATT